MQNISFLINEPNVAEQRCTGAAVYMAETGEIGELRQELEKKASCCQVRAVCISHC